MDLWCFSFLLDMTPIVSDSGRVLNAAKYSPRDMAVLLRGTNP